MYKREIIKNLNYKQICALFVWFFKHPFFMLATVKATIITLRVAQKEFPNIHGLHNKANAFRHAIWNIFIAKECAKFSDDLDKVLRWTKQITDWHEEFSPNEEMAKLMDLHNNKIGRKYFLKLKDKSKSEIVDALCLKLENAKKINLKSTLEKIDNLVFLKD
ncbi:DUF6973 domain-containing protein [Polaribacter sp.]|uniref:DUF6973 domain-containing protein n=1 Tax=Polaribacter sp. TaxID=1920175 RepID=UPI003F6D6C57